MQSFKRQGVFSFLSLFLLVNVACAQPRAIKTNWGRVMFYNTENLFDTVDNPQTNDADFLPSGKLKWDKTRYENKLMHIAQVIEAAEFPAVIGFSEVENDTVLNDLVKQQVLADKGYAFVHYNSPDERGIDVALIYRKNLFTPSYTINLPVKFPLEPEDKTRDILYVKGSLKGETYHFFINHWPSRSEGEEKTRPRRMAAALTARHIVDSLFNAEKDPQIVLMGDFNDHPTDSSLIAGLGAINDIQNIDANKLYNLAARWQAEGKGTHKYKGEWGTLDQIIVSSAVLNGKGIYCRPDAANIGEFDFLLEPDTRNGGVWPKRTYGGDKYLDGYSDHLPVYLNLMVR